MNNLKFKPEDFKEYDLAAANQIELANYTNEKLKQLLKCAVRVYGQIYNHGSNKKLNNFTEINSQDSVAREHNDTHTGLLINIEEIEKPKCEHKPIFICYGMNEKGPIDGHYECKHCGAKLKATWSET